jgi:hypothetical protein
MANVLSANEAGSGRDRRSFMKGAALGLAGAAAISSLSAEAQSPAAGEVQDPQAPAGLKKGAEPDSRFPVFYESSVPEGMKLVVAYFKALSQRDLEGVADTLHYPFVSYERNEPVVIDSREALLSSPPPSMDVNDKGADSKRNQIHFRPGSFDLLENIQMHIANPLGAGFSIESSRYRSDGWKLQVVHTLVGVTNNDGKWGIEFLSPILLPADQITETYDAKACITALHDDWRIHGEGRFNGNTTPKVFRNSNMFVGKSVDVWLGGSSANSGPARAGNPMAPYKIKGVTSRLRQQETTQAQLDRDPTPEDLAKGEEAGRRWMQVSGTGTDPWYESWEFPDTKILFGSNSKCHMYSGYRRYTADGTFISEQRFITAAVCRAGVWNTSDIHGMFGQIMYHEHANDVHTEGV